MIRMLAFLTFLTALENLGVAYAEEPVKPNIVFVLFDDLGWGQPQCYDRQSSLRTPHLDRLASQGMRFTDAHSAAAVCTPTRYGILTGRYPSRIGQYGVLGTWSPPIIPRSRATVASILKQQGYDTACVGKWHLGLSWEQAGEGVPRVGMQFSGGPNELGFDYFCGFTHAANIGTILEQDRVVAAVKEEENQPLMLRKAVEWLQGRDSKKPFFLYFPMCPPHYPVAPAAEFIGRSGGVDVAGRGLKGQANPAQYPDWLYQGDAMLGEIMRVLDSRGLADNTLLIATSDNGAEHRVYAPLRESKRSIYEGGHRVPFVVRWPGRVQAGSTWTHTICLNDLLATAAELSGAVVPTNAGEDSVSLVPALLATSSAGTREATIHQSMGGDLAIRQGPWKLIRRKNAVCELYQLEQDLSETKDLAGDMPALVEELTTLLRGYSTAGRSTPGPPQTNDSPLFPATNTKGRTERKAKADGSEKQ